MGSIYVIKYIYIYIDYRYFVDFGKSVTLGVGWPVCESLNKNNIGALKEGHVITFTQVSSSQFKQLCEVKSYPYLDTFNLVWSQ